MNRMEEYGEELAAVRQDGRLKQLLRIHLGRPDAPSIGAEPSASDLAPALFSHYRGLAALRYDYPVVLLDHDADRCAVPLADIIGELIRSANSSEPGGEQYCRDLYQLEANIKQVAAKGTEQRLSTLWDTAARQCLATAQDARRRQVMRENLNSARGAIEGDGVIADCDPQISRCLFAHAGQLIQSEQGRQARGTLDELIAELRAILESDRMRSARATTADALRTSMGDTHAGGINFEILSSVLRSSQHQRPLTVSRRKRVRSVLKALKTERNRLRSQSGKGKSPRRRPATVTIETSCVAALEKLRGAVQHLVELFRALRIARLEVENRYDEARHDSFFEAFGVDQLTPEELRGLPPLFVHLDTDALDAENRTALIEILSSDLPIKVLVELRTIPDGIPMTAGPGGFGGWGTSLASMAVMLRTAYVLQTTAANLPRLAGEIIAGLRYEGPALFSVYSGPAEEHPLVPRYLHCASALESRVFPCFVHDPGRGPECAQRFQIMGNPQPEESWPMHEFSYEDAEGRAMSDEVAFTALDFLFMDPRFAGQYVTVPSDSWHPNMVSLGEYLSLSERHTFGKVPYLWTVDADDVLRRVIVRRGLIMAARRCHDMWRNLQELGGIRNSHALRLLEAERERAASIRDHQLESLETVEETDLPRAEAAPDTSESTTAVNEEAEAEALTAAADQAYIETDLCTSCNDCTDRNGMLFAYNEVKQAYIKDASAGTFRELVEAAENCPVCIIHPGRPLNQDEPSLDDLLKRASAFN